MGEFSEETGNTSEAARHQYVLVATLCLSVCQMERSLPHSPLTSQCQELHGNFHLLKRPLLQRNPIKFKSCRCFNAVHACKASGFASYSQ